MHFQPISGKRLLVLLTSLNKTRFLKNITLLKSNAEQMDEVRFLLDKNGLQCSQQIDCTVYGLLADEQTCSVGVVLLKT